MLKRCLDDPSRERTWVNKDLDELRAKYEDLLS